MKSKAISTVTKSLPYFSDNLYKSLVFNRYSFFLKTLKYNYPDFSNIVYEEIEVPSHDGVLVPLSIVYDKTKLKKDGSNVGYMTGYVSYGTSGIPYFNPMEFSLMDRGMVRAVAHVRGGGEKGNDWHQAAVLDKKPNSWKDLHAYAEYLIEKGFTSKGKIVISGASAGGILVGRAVIDRPELYAAAKSEVGLLNPMRMEFTPNAMSGIKEFGTVTDKVQVNYLYEMDSYHQTKDGEFYPGQYVTGGYEDPRVVIWQPAKYVAAMQAANRSDRPILFKVNMEGGNFGNNFETVYRDMAESFAFLFWQTGHPDFQPKK